MYLFLPCHQRLDHLLQLVLAHDRGALRGTVRHRRGSVVVMLLRDPHGTSPCSTASTATTAGACDTPSLFFLRSALFCRQSSFPCDHCGASRLQFLVDDILQHLQWHFPCTCSGWENSDGGGHGGGHCRGIFNCKRCSSSGDHHGCTGCDEFFQHVFHAFQFDLKLLQSKNA